MENYSKDTFKVYVSLINMIKNNEKININNKLLNIEIESIPSNQLKFLIEMESCNSNQINVKELQEIQRKLQTLNKSVLQNSEQVLTSRKILLKIKCFILAIYIKNSDLNNAVILINKIISFIQDQEEMKYALKILFRVESLLCLQRLDISKLKKKSLKTNEIQNLYYLIAVIKLVNYETQARKIIVEFLDKTKFNEENVVQKTKVLRAMIKILIQKQKELLKLNKDRMIQEQPSRVMYHESTKKMIKNKLYVDYKIDLDDPRDQIQKKIHNIDQRCYLTINPLFHLYYENNNQIIGNLSQTQLHRKLGTTKSILVETLPLNSDSKVKRSKSRITLKRNPLLYSLYLEETVKNCQNIYVESCTKGEIFIKHNFNNLYNAVKCVKLTQQNLMWGKQKKDIDKNSTKIKMEQIMGVLYGRPTARHQQYEDNSKQSLSFVMKDRTLDLTVYLQKDKSQIHNFVLGASWIINQYHQAQKKKCEAELEVLSSTSNQQAVNNKITYHSFKQQTITRGKLLWSDLFASLSMKTNKNMNKLMPKAKNIITLLGISGQSSKILNNSLNNSLSNIFPK